MQPLLYDLHLTYPMILSITQQWLFNYLLDINSLVSLLQWLWLRPLLIDIPLLKLLHLFQILCCFLLNCLLLLSVLSLVLLLTIIIPISTHSRSTFYLLSSLFIYLYSIHSISYYSIIIYYQHYSFWSTLLSSHY